MTPPPPRALLIGGFDPSAGAGVLLDAFVAARLGFQPAAVVTTVTAQNSSAWFGAELVSADIVSAQLAALAAEGPFACVKIGALGSAANVETVAGFLDACQQPFVVLDPVLTSSSGGALAEQSALVALERELLGAVDLLTPNATEARVLAPHADSPSAAATKIAERHGVSVLITGLPDTSGMSADLLVVPGQPARRLTHEHLHEVGDPRGTGCMLSTAIACRTAEWPSPRPHCNASGRHVGGPPADADGIARAVASAQDDVLGFLGGVSAVGTGRLQLDLVTLLAPRL